MHIGIAKCLFSKLSERWRYIAFSDLGHRGIRTFVRGGCVARIEAAEQDASERKPNIT
jgi:hypothetical protein